MLYFHDSAVWPGHYSSLLLDRLSTYCFRQSSWSKSRTNATFPVASGEPPSTHYSGFQLRNPDISSQCLHNLYPHCSFPGFLPIRSSLQLLWVNPSHRARLPGLSLPNEFSPTHLSAQRMTADSLPAAPFCSPLHPFIEAQPAPQLSFIFH